MSEPDRLSPLANDVFADCVPPDLRERMIARMVDQRRTRRRLGGVNAVVATLAILLALAWVRFGRPHPRIFSPSYQLVRTEALTSAQQVSTARLAFSQLVASEPATIISTGHPSHIRELSDRELMALVGNRAALSRTGAHSEKLIFLRRQDEDGFPLN